MFLCGGKKQKTQMRTLALESHLFTLRNNTEDILKIQYNAEKMQFESQDKEMLIKGKKLQELHQFNEATLVQQIEDQIVDIEKAKLKKQAKLDEIYEMEREILQNEIEIQVIKNLIRDDEKIVKNLQKYDIKFALDLQEKYRQSIEEIEEEMSQKPVMRSEGSANFQNPQQVQRRTSTSRAKLSNDQES
ncbi:unnamed protein product [Paramecium pentaurelia]|uniref:Uncharacterized protein n=1 Tax=Paramecium pentaurelia TaxID=43138 RepID=A0A8S1VE55_9CILI|nr:unnamed protein product [Paramecium pentaurelia]